DSIRILNGKATFVDAYPAVLMGGATVPNPGVPTNAALVALLARFNMCRQAQNLPAVTRLSIPAFTHGDLDDAPGQYEKDLLRAYNGLCGPRYLGHSRHQFQLEEDAMCGLVLDVDDTTHTGTIHWVEVDPATRCTGCPQGTRDYVERVLSMQLPTCSHPALAAVCAGDDFPAVNGRCQ
ncbi:MAG TPA: hypothetical protein VN851_07525, partial [Thermoanaerobaculia bacterium]|nr:hypothetical protein [Thermoanaerobaculia bacterium]